MQPSAEVKEFYEGSQTPYAAALNGIAWSSSRLIGDCKRRDVNSFLVVLMVSASMFVGTYPIHP